MPLSEQQIYILKTSIEQFDYPKVTFDFSRNVEIEHPTIRSVEQTIKVCLLSRDPEEVKDGFSNILFWGYYRVGHCWQRVNKFRNQIADKIEMAIRFRLIQNIQGAGLRDIKNLQLPQFSNISFISRVRMFLDPDNFVILNKKLMEISQAQTNTIFQRIKEYKTYIPITKNNEHFYQEWCDICKYAARTYFDAHNLFAADIERGFFRLVDIGRVEEAAMIVANVY